MMNSLKEYIKINESFDLDNLYYKIDTWFANNPTEREEFGKMISNCRDLGTNNNALLKKYCSTYDTVGMIDFMMDNVKELDQNVNYEYAMQKMVDTVIGDKSEKNPFNNK